LLENDFHFPYPLPIRDSPPSCFSFLRPNFPLFCYLCACSYFCRMDLFSASFPRPSNSSKNISNSLSSEQINSWSLNKFQKNQQSINLRTHGQNERKHNRDSHPTISTMSRSRRRCSR